MNVIFRVLPPNSFAFCRWIVASIWNLKHLATAFFEALNGQISVDLKNYILTWMQRGDHRGPTGKDLLDLCGHLIAEMLRIFVDHLWNDLGAALVFGWFMVESIVQANEVYRWTSRRRNRILPMS
jgi:hypothetical protein